EHVFGPAELIAPIIDEYVEALRRPEAPPPSETFDVDSAPAKPTEPIIDEYVEELRRPEPLIETIEPSAPAEPPELSVEELRRPEASPPIEAFEVTVAPAEPVEPFVADYIEDVVRHEPIEPMIDRHVVPANDITTTPPAPTSAPDPRLAALWDAASPPTEAESA